jgi:thiol-disulfide isomerase/thioredoxin
MKKYFFVFIALIFLASCNGQTKQEKPPVAKPVINDLPQMEIVLLDGSKKQARELTGKTILVMFFPDCEHCQEEAQAMEANLSAFKAYTIYFLSSNPQPEIEKFAADYKLTGKDNVKFGMITGESVINNFGPIPTPSIYIYNDWRLMKSFNGQTDIEVVKSAL